MLVFLIALASVMAAFGIIGYQKGWLAMLVMLGILFVTVAAIETASETIIRYLNGLYIGTMLVFKSGLNDLASGDLDSAAAKLEDIEKPFQGATVDAGLFLVLMFGVVLGFLVALLFRKRRKGKVLGAGIGIAYGYLLSAAVLPLLLGVPAGNLPIPFLRPYDPQAPQTAPAASAGGGGSLVDSLSQPETVRLVSLLIMVGLAVFLLLTARRSAKKG